MFYQNVGGSLVEAPSIAAYGFNSGTSNFISKTMSVSPFWQLSWSKCMKTVLNKGTNLYL